MVDKAQDAGELRPHPRCPRAEPHLAFGPCDTPCKTWRHSLENGPCRDAPMRVCCRWSVIRGFGLLNQIRCGGFVNPRSSMPALSAYSSPLAPYAEHTSGSALLDAGALCHPPPLPAPSRQPAFNESKLSSRLRNFNHANRVRELRSTCDGRSAALCGCFGNKTKMVPSYGRLRMLP